MNPFDWSIYFILMTYSFLILFKVPDWTKIVLVSILMIGYIQYRNSLRYNMIAIENKSLVNVEMKSGELLLQTSNDFRYIGSLRNYILFYDSFSKKVMIYPTSNFEWISIKEIEKKQQ